MDKSTETYQCLSPVVIIVFNRPDKTKLLLAALKQVEPRKLYVIADGARANHPTDNERVAQVRGIIDGKIDWNCEVIKIYADKNMGGPKRVPSGLDIVFEKEERAIIVEDDCIPIPQFFQFTDELLERYKSDERIGTICGFNLEFDFWGRPIDGKRNTSYFFSKIPASWGWATWQRVWNNFDREMKDFPDMLKNRQFENMSKIKSVQRYFKKKYALFYEGKKNNWDYRLTYSLFKNNQLSVIPNNCLITNIGADGSGQNFDKKDYVSLKSAKAMPHPFIHPQVFQPDYRYERRTMLHFSTDNKFYKGMGIVRNFLLRKKL